MNFTHTFLAPDDKHIKMWESPLFCKRSTCATREERPLKTCFLPLYSQQLDSFSFFLKCIEKQLWTRRLVCFNVCLCAFNWLGIYRLLIYLFIMIREWWEGRWSRLNLSPADLLHVRHCLSAITTICHRESLKTVLCTLPSGQTHFSCCYSSTPTPPPLQNAILPISKRKTKAGKQGNEGISFGSTFWALTLTEADLSGFAKLLLDSLSTAATSMWFSETLCAK